MLKELKNVLIGNLILKLFGLLGEDARTELGKFLLKETMNVTFVNSMEELEDAIKGDKNKNEYYN